MCLPTFSHIFTEFGLLGSKIYHLGLPPVLQKMTQFGSGQNVFIRVSLGSKLFLFGPVLGPIFKGGFDFSEFNLIFLGLIIQEIKFLVGFSRVCPHFHMFAHIFTCLSMFSRIFTEFRLLGSKIYHLGLPPVLQKMTRFGSGF